MSLIIAATDFSEIAENAANYACALASDQQAKLLVIHSYLIPVMFNDLPMSGSLINDTQHDAESQMDKLVINLRASYPGMDIKGMVIYGDFIDAINDCGNENIEPLLIVLGNSAEESPGWPDSTIADILHKLNYPVLAVPPGVAYQPIKKICFAFDNLRLNNYRALDRLAALVTLLKAELHVLNVQADVHNQDNSPDFILAAKERLDHVNALYHIKFGASHVDDAIHDFVCENNINLLVMIPRKHSFFEGLFHKSHTNAAARTSAIPVLAIHDSQM